MLEIFKLNFHGNFKHDMLEMELEVTKSFSYLFFNLGNYFSA